MEPVFHEDSYGYRPGRSALDAVGVCRERCWRQDWVLDLDIRAFFDRVPWDLVLKAVAHHTDQRWILMYVERWLKAPLQLEDGSLIDRDRGTPQGSSISPLLANMFLHSSRSTPGSPSTSASSKARQDRWVFGDRNSGAFMHRFAWTNIVRHPIVKHRASADDPGARRLLGWRRRNSPLPINHTALRLRKEQDAPLRGCKTTLLAASDRRQTPREREHWLATTRKTIDVVWDAAISDTAAPRLIDLHCNTTRQPRGLARAGCRETGTSGS